MCVTKPDVSRGALRIETHKTRTELYSLLFAWTLFAASYRILSATTAAAITTTDAGHRHRVGSLFGPVSKAYPVI